MSLCFAFALCVCVVRFCCMFVIVLRCAFVLCVRVVRLCCAFVLCAVSLKGERGKASSV